MSTQQKSEVRDPEHTAQPQAAPRAELDRILAPVQEDLERTEECLANLLNSPHRFIQTLAGHIEQLRGKRLRPALLHLSARAFGGEAPLACEVAALVELVHLTSLCHDDVLDDASTRRNVSTLNAAWGNKSAVMTGDFLFSRAFEQVSKLDDPRPLRILARAARLICEGELLQIGARFDTHLSQTRYYDLIEKKTGVLFAAAAELGALLAGAGQGDADRLYAFGRHIGLAFQITDDCLDVAGSACAAGKSLGADLRNGEYTLPVIHLLERFPLSQNPDLAALFRPGNELLTRERLRPYLEQAGSLNYAFQVARRELECARDELASLPNSGAKQALLRLPEFILRRSE